MANVAVILAVFSALVAGALCQSQKVRYCVPELLRDYCQQLEAEFSDVITCVFRPDRFDCMRALELNEADTTIVDAQNIYIAGKQFFLSVLAYEEINRAPYRYSGVALVKKSLQLSSLADLKGKRSCHTGVHRTVGWQIPITQLQSLGIMTPNCEGELATVADFFNQSCAAHQWSPDPIVDAELKRKYPSLCALCGNPETCTRGDAYGGYEGSLRCLADDRGDIAFSKIDAVEEFLQTNPDLVAELDYLCLDGTRRPVSEEADLSCTWGRRPSNAFLVSDSVQSEEARQQIYNTLHDIFVRYSPNIPQVQHQQRPEWFTEVFVSNPNVTNIVQAPQEQRDWINYLGDFRLTIDRYFGECQPKIVKFCTTSDAAQSKCTDLSIAAFARRSNAKIECVQAEDLVSCIAKVNQSEADLVTLDGGDVYKAGRYSELVPLAAEIYGEDSAKYYAVAVIPADSEVNKIEDLRGKTSCHTGMGRTAGWVIPTSTLVNAGEISGEQCNKITAIADYFSASCVPGANDPRYNPTGYGSEKLCQQCIGDEAGEHKCSRGSEERYSGYGGAFRCLAEGKGHVAFVKHTTVPQYTDNNSQLPWANNLQSENFKLLCPDGGTSSVQDYQNCNLARVPSHYTMTTGSATTDDRRDRSELLALVSKFLGKDSKNFNTFKLYNGLSDLLFKDSTTSLRIVSFDSTYRGVLGEKYFKAVESTDAKVCSQ